MLLAWFSVRGPWCVGVSCFTGLLASCALACWLLGGSGFVGIVAWIMLKFRVSWFRARLGF